MRPKASKSQTNEPTKCFIPASYLARKYSVSERHILLLAAANKIPSIRVGTKCVRFDEQAVAAVLEGPGRD